MTEIVRTEILAALDRLNVHARAYGCGSKAIYAYKTVATLAAVTGHAESARPVGLILKCTGCDGTGRFQFWDGGDGGVCRRCSPGVRGYQRLRFVETTIGEIRWHHPWHHGGEEVLRAAWGAERFEISPESPTGFYDTIIYPDGAKRKFQIEDPGDWTPRQPGAKLQSDDAATLLTKVERWLLDEAPASLGGPLDRARSEMRRYNLDLDRSYKEPCCCFCGIDLSDAERVINLGIMARKLEFRRRCCRGCHDSRSPKDWPQDVPDILLTPAVRGWLELRKGR